MKPTILMCPPDHYGIEYEINPWMKTSNNSIKDVASKQWISLHKILCNLDVKVEKVEPQSTLPDMCFIANAGLVYKKRFISSRFLHDVRQKETPHYDDWFLKHNFIVEKLPEEAFFEGAGDALFCGSTLYAGYGFRSNIESHKYLSQSLKKRVVSLQLVDPYFYHLDTCFCPIDNGKAIYYPGAFDFYAVKSLKAHIPTLIEVSSKEAERFACNAVVIGKTIITNTGCDKLRAKLRALGYTVISTKLDEFLKAGGSAKCLTLRLDGEEATKKSRQKYISYDVQDVA